MDDTAVHTDLRAIVRLNQSRGFFDPERYVPAERVLDNPCARNPSPAPTGDAWQRAGPAESHPPHHLDRNLRPATIQADDAKSLGLWIVDGHLTTTPLEPRPLHQSPVVLLPGARVLLEDLLGSLGRELGEPLVTRDGVGAGVAKLPVDLSKLGTPGDTTVAPGVPLMQQVPERAGGVCLSFERRLLDWCGVETDDMGATHHVVVCCCRTQDSNSHFDAPCGRSARLTCIRTLVRIHVNWDDRGCGQRPRVRLEAVGASR